MHSCTDTQAVCRGCGKLLRGNPYWKGGRAYHPDGKGSVKACYYGGWVCSRSCDYKACLELEESMPGHRGQAKLDIHFVKRLDEKWGDSI